MVKPSPAQALQLRKLSGRIGVEILGVELGGGISEDLATSIKSALIEHKVIFFRGQSHIDDEIQEAFAARLGNPEGHPTIPTSNGKFLFELDSRYGGKANSWHTDSTYVPDYPWATVLRAVELPSYGGDTCWCNTAAGYLHLPAPLRDLADRLWAVHTNDYDYGATKPQLSDDEVEAKLKMITATLYETEHPVVRIHPATKERCIVLGHFVKKFVGLSIEDSASIYALLQKHLTRPENIVRWTWQPGDVAIWDNRSTQHYAVDDYDERRVMRRVTLSGEVPFSITGEPSRPKKPVSSASVPTERAEQSV